MRRLILSLLILAFALPSIPAYAQQDPWEEQSEETHAHKVYEHVLDVLEEDQAIREKNRADYGEKGKSALFRAYMWLRTGFIKKIFWLEATGAIGIFLFWNNKHLIRSIFLLFCVILPVMLILLLFLGGNRF